MKEIAAETVMVNFDRKQLSQLKKAYIKAKKAGEKVFTFGKAEWDVNYAGYVIIYLDDKFGIIKIK